jgi:VWFA-related protein
MPPRLRSCGVILAVVVGGVCFGTRPGLRAQTPTPAQDPPQFRSELTRVTVDATVVDQNGAPIRDLKLEEFHLEVDGKPRALRSIELVAFDQSPGTEAGVAVDGTLPEISTNSVRTPSRLVLIVVDRESLPASQSKPFMQAGVDFVKQLRATDRLGLLAMPDGPRVDFTRDHQRIAEALGGIIGDARDLMDAPRVSIREAFDIDRRAPGVFESVYSRECVHRNDPNEVDHCRLMIPVRVRDIIVRIPAIASAKLRMLQRVIEAFAKVEGPKAVVLLSQGIPYGDFLPPEVNDIGKIAARAGISVYAVQVFHSLADAGRAGVPPDLEADRRMLTDGLANLASASGGALLQPTGTIGTAFQRIARELSARYVLSFDAEPGDRDGKAHRIELKVARDSSRLVRYRREFDWHAPAATPAPDAPAAPASTDVAQTLGRLLATGEIRSDLPLQLATFTMPQLAAPGQRTTLWLHLNGPAPANVRVEVFNDKNVRVVAADKVIDLTSTSTDGALDFLTSAALPAGRYVARVAAQDGTGKVGSAEHPFDARLGGAADLRVGNLMLLDERSIAAGRPTPIRDAGTAQAFHAYLELQATSTPDWRTIQGTLEIVDPADGHVRSTAPLTLRETNDATRQIVEAVVPLNGWQAGSALVRASLTRKGAPLATITRTLVLDTPRPASTSDASAGSTPTTASATVSAEAVSEALAHGIAFVNDYIQRSASVVAEEHYVQIIRAGPADPRRRDTDEALEWRADDANHRASLKDAKKRRQMISDVLMVKTKDGLWTNFRDVGTLDGRELKDRSKRAVSLFAQDGTDVGATLRRIADESSRLNLGGGGNFNVPALALQVLDSTQRSRFEFGSAGGDTVDGVPTIVVTYRETSGPTFIRSVQKNEPVFISGKLWLVPTDGRILRSEMQLHDERNHLSTQIIVQYRLIPELNLLMPVEMWERYTPDQPLADYVERRARYSKYRRFSVSVSESTDVK